MWYKKIELKPVITKNKPGELIDLDINKICFNNGINFTFTKSFLITNLNSNKSRGNHSNENAKECLFCSNGSFDIYMHNGKEETNLKMKKNDLLFINNNVWIEMRNFVNCSIIAFVYLLPNKKKSCYNFSKFIDDNKNK